MRLDKLLAYLGYGSRKEVKELIKSHSVIIDGKVIRDGAFKVDEYKSEILVDNKKVYYDKFVYYIMNKPQDYVCATVDLYPTVLDLMSGENTRNIFPVGRLDKDTTGLLLLTNDGNFAHRMLSPKKHVDKVYEVTYSGTFLNKHKDILEEGITLEDGEKCKPAKWQQLEENKGLITISEGKYHQIKRMFAVMDLTVTALNRISFGPLSLPSDLELGSYRRLNEKEMESLNSYLS